MNENKNKNENEKREIIAVGYAGKWAGGRVIFRKVRAPWGIQRSSE